MAPNRLKILYEKGELISGEPLELTGGLKGKPELAVGGFFVELKTERVVYKGVEKNVSGNVRLFATVLNEQSAREYEQLRLQRGAVIRVACELRREDKYSNPGTVSTKEILDQKELDAAGVIKSPLLVERLSDAQLFSPLSWALEQRQDLILDFKKYFSVSTAGVLIASLLGNHYHLDKNTSKVFREGGIFHFLVISGLHITFIGAVTVFLVRFLTRRKIWQFIIANVFLWVFSFAVGAQIPVIRAAVMFTILHFAGVVFRQASLLNALGASALLLLVWRPADFFDQSFQLTFLCVTAIVATAFPLLEKIRAIGEWRPGAETPVPPACSKKLKAFFETLYWSETEWRRDQSRSVWQAKLFKTPLAAELEQRHLQRVLRHVFEMLLVSVVVQAWLVPLMIVYFHRISIAGIFLNIWVGILMALESLTAVVGILTAQVSETLALPLFEATEILNWFLIHTALWFVEQDWASFRLPHYSGALKFVYVLYFFPVLAITFGIYKWQPFKLSQNREEKAGGEKNTAFFSAFDFGIGGARALKFWSAVYIVLLLVVTLHPFSAPQPDGRLHIDFLDVGQGDAALITLPTGETLLVDGGGKQNFNKFYVKRDDEEPEIFEPDTQSVGETVVSTFLWEKGYDKIDYILATHADTDHIQGLADVARNFEIRTAIFGRKPVDDPDFAELYNVLQKRSVPLLTLARHDAINLGGVKIEVLYPPRDEMPGAVSDNNHSVVLRVIYGARKFLLTGDIEKETENELSKSPELLQSDVVKVPHHGSKTSSTRNFIDAARAKVAVIPVGRGSQFGHPKPEIVERWKTAGAKVLTTGENGTISFSTDGGDLRLKTFKGKPSTH